MKEKLQRRNKKRKFSGIDEHKLKIQPSHVFYLIEYLKSAEVRYVVAPYEADAQLAWMARNNMVDAVQTDDSDLVLFGCPKVLFNLNLCVKSASLGDCLICELDSILNDNFPDLSREQFVQACIFAGCDYIQCLSSPSFRKNGITKGIRLIRDHGTYDKVITHLSSQWSKNIISVEEFRIKYEKVVLLNNHQCVYDLQKEQAAYLTSLPESFTFAADPTLEFLGKLMPNDEMKGIAAGDINPKTRKAIAMGKGGKPL
ncbi:hypothetical protein AQUCO_00201074v1 [Aquilegia coerulea]|uniref:XPG-I domain-containing protein n=1 Tax=Aquilegia coerulea TaxID=218851 RepID=A0A2G5F633_AQUCA|nr:hypothetical protein AQUCO_00201074v1 [Aquilegia coerulea]